MASTHRQSTEAPPGDGFATTRWSVIVSAGRQSSAQSRQALEALCEMYWIPVYGYVRRRVTEVAEAQDLTQAFFADLLERRFVNDADPQRGRFRAYLLTALKHFLSKQWEKQRAQKRGGGRLPISLNFDDADSRIRIEPTGGLTAEQIYDRQWALTLLAQILDTLQSEYDSKGRSEYFQVLKPFLVGDCTAQTYLDASSQLEMTEPAARMAVSRMRQRYRQLLRDEIAQTVASEGDVDAEIRNLFATLGG